MILKHRLGLTGMLLGLALSTVGTAQAQTPNETFGQVRKLVTTDAIDTQGLVEIGGI